MWSTSRGYDATTRWRKVFGAGYVWGLFGTASQLAKAAQPSSVLLVRQ